MGKKMKVLFMSILLLNYTVFFFTDFHISYAAEQHNEYAKALASVRDMDLGSQAKIGNEYKIVNEHGEEYGKALGYFVGDTPYGYAIYNSEKDRITEFVFEKGIENAYHELVDENSSKLLPDNLELLNGLVVNEEDPFTYYLSDIEGNTIDNYGSYQKGKIENKKELNKILGKKKDQLLLGGASSGDYGFQYDYQLPYYYAGRYPKTFMGNYSKNILISNSDVYYNSSKGYACGAVAAIECLQMMNKLYKGKWQVYDELWNKCNMNSDGVTSQYNLANGLNQYFREHYYSSFTAYENNNPTFSSFMWYVDHDRKSILLLNPQNEIGHFVALLGYYSYYFEQNKCNNYVIVANGRDNDAERYIDMDFMKEMYNHSVTYISPKTSTK